MSVKKTNENLVERKKVSKDAVLLQMKEGNKKVDLWLEPRGFEDP